MRILKISLILITTLLFSCKPSQEKIDKMVYESSEKILNSDNQGAIEDLTKVIGWDETNYLAYYYRANAKFNLRQAKEALLDYDKSIQLNPNYADAFYNRGFCKQYLNDKDGACSDWYKAQFLGKPNVKDMLNYCP